MAIITVADNYAILNSDRTFKEWRYLVEGTEYNENLVLAKLTIAPPNHDPATEKLVENISVGDREVTQSWEVQQLNPEEIAARKKPDPSGFLKAAFSGENKDLFDIYQKILDVVPFNPEANKWFTVLLQAHLPQLFTVNGWNTAIAQLAIAVPLEPDERNTVNSYLAKYDLDEVL